MGVDECGVWVCGCVCVGVCGGVCVCVCWGECVCVCVCVLDGVRVFACVRDLVEWCEG